MRDVFNPRSSYYKNPFGAIPCGGRVELCCRPLAMDNFSHCSVVIRREFAGIQEETELHFSGYWEDRACFSASLELPEKPDLLWYHFRFWRDNGTGCLYDKTGYRSQGEPADWQLTVYQESHTPEWFGAGVTYQIFPDRFCRLAIPDPSGMVGNRWVHENWEDLPAWRPENGEIKNRDFFGGSLKGVQEHLDDLADLGVSTIYFCPIFEAASNHRYNTANYERIDPMLGTEEDFRTLCAAAKQRGIRVILDGVFNHTGSQSIYFNEDGYYPTLGAAQSMDSPYYPWFSFINWPHTYESWWGITTLPNVREDNPAYVDYIIENEDSIVRRWLRVGASGWRLDVADELPDEFIVKLRQAVEGTDPEALVIGEVWEDASNKISYSKRRKYLLGQELHGVMNYPFRTAILSYLLGGNASEFREAMETIRENYPPMAFYSAMNFLGTHDTPRILTILGGAVLSDDREWQSTYRLSPEQRALGLARVRLAAMALFTFPGSPMVYYGDEVGMEGCGDPFNRGTFPWGREDTELQDWFRKLGKLRKARASLQRGELRWISAEGPLLSFARVFEGEATVTVINAGPEDRIFMLGDGCTDLMSGEALPGGGLRLSPHSGRVLDGGCFT